MIKIEETIISKIVLHRISSDESICILSDTLFEYSVEEDLRFFNKIFLKPFISNSQTFEFKHDVDLDYNVLFNLSKEIFQDKGFIDQSVKIAQQLISLSKHPNIKDGELFIVKFEDINLNNKLYEGVGIYKFEDKDNYLETTVENNKFDISFRKGIGSKKPDKACLILFTEEPYTILIIDSNNNETDYWQNEFINHKPKNDNINNTTDFLKLAKNFVTKQLNEEFEVTKADQIDYLNRSLDYFKTNDTFDKQEFEQAVFKDEGVIESFRTFDEAYRMSNELDISDSFDISSQAVKKQARIFKSVLKLDKNFHIYIHGNRELIEQGVEPDGRKFYKIYFKEEE